VRGDFQTLLRGFPIRLRVVGLLFMVACSPPGAATDISTSSSAAAGMSTPTSQPTSLPASTSTTPSTTTTDSTTTSEEPTTTAGQPDQGDLAGWETATITIGTTELLVAVADDSSERRQGLIGVDEFGDLDGMLFQFPKEAISGFWMKGTLTPLDIDFFGDDMEFVDRLSMVPCSAETCPIYAPNAPFSWALETPAGTVPTPAEGAILSLGVVRGEGVVSGEW